MQDLSSATDSEFKSVRFLLTDMDETLTFQGKLASETYSALERLQKAGVRVIPVTAAPAGWCDQMARMWPIDGVIGENGGLFFQRASDAHTVTRRYWHAHEEMSHVTQKLEAIGKQVLHQVPQAVFASDQPFRQTSLAFDIPKEKAVQDGIIESLRTQGADVTINNLWILGWLGGYDKLAMTRRTLKEFYDIDIDNGRELILYTGDSTNDAPMFAYFKYTVGMSTVRQYLPEILVPPAYITTGPGGAGFIEAANAILRSKL